jgi:hypothetical protein
VVALSNDLASQFAKLLNDGNDKKQKETSMYGTFVESGKKKYVKLDGSELLTPVIQTAAAKDGERVTVTVKNRTAVVTGNLSSPAARSGDVEDLSAKVLFVEELMAKKVSTDELEATIGRIETLETDNATIRDTLTAQSAKIDDLETDNATINGTLTAQSAKIDNLETTKLSAEIAEITYATITNLDATNVAIRNLDADYGKFKDATVESFRATEADIESLNTTKLSAEQADIRYANIDFSNIGKAAIEQFYATSGIIKDLVIGDQTVTGELVGVTIKGDLIEGNTIKADKLVVKGSDGLYYKLNVSAETVETEQTDQNSLNGNIITAKSITATKISVEDLVAFDATIGGFNITDNAIYSGVKSSIDNTTRGIYQDKDGQIAFGDRDSFLKYFKDKDGKYKLAISADNIKFSASNKDLDTVLGSTITSAIEEFYLSKSPTSLSGGSWSKTQPTWTEGKYIWRRTAVTYGDGSSEYTPSPNGVCITGNTGAKGDTGEGIKSTAVTYQAGASGTTVPTGTWSASIPAADTSKPYLWTRTIITYTDNTKSTSYSVGATPEGMVQKKKIISEINQSAEEISIKAEKISLEGLVTANENFKVLEDGSIEAKNGKFTGEIYATSGKFEGEIVSSKATITGGSMTIKAADNDYKAIDIYWGNPNTQGEDGYYTTQISPGSVYGYGYNGGHSGSFRLDFDGLTLTGAGANIRCLDITAAGAINGRYWNWSRQGGQPSWLWGGNDGVNMYVYNPSNFSVNYAKSANYANSAGGISAPIYGYDKNINITCGGWNTPASVTLPAGTYIGMVFAKMYGTPTSRMVMVFSTNSGATDAGAYMSDDNMDRACCSSPVVINVSGNTNFYLRVYNSMSGVRACHCGWYLVKVK